jgi:GNAT superfamily N-acetyltransferase
MIVLYEPSLLDATVDLAKKMHLESRYKDLPFISAKFETLLKNPSTFCALVKSDQKFIGGILGMVQESWFSSTKIGFDLALYMVPEYRGTTLAPIRLIKLFEDFCKQRGCCQISLSSSASIQDKSALRLYEKLGYINCGFTTYKNIKGL